MAKGKKVGVHGTDEETGRAKEIKTSKACPVTEEEFLENAKPAALNVPDLSVAAILNPKKFSSGSLGFFANGKTVVTVNGKPCAATFQTQVILNKSKPGSEGEGDE